METDEQMAGDAGDNSLATDLHADQAASGNEDNEITCGQRCPHCNRPCRGYAGHDGAHQCNQHHTW